MRRCKRLFFHPAGKARGVQIRRCQGIAVKYDGFTLGVLALTPLKLLRHWGIRVLVIFL